jgi:ActD protein
MKPGTGLYGLMAEFDAPDDLIAAVNRVYDEGYRDMNAYSPFPVHGLSEALGFRRTRLPLLVLLGGIIGCLGGFFLQYYAAVIDYPFNIGGRPLNSWPAFIPVTFECTILVAGLTAVLGMLGMNELPMPYHPVFNVPRFELASRTHFFLCIRAKDPKFDRQATRSLLESLGAHDIVEVEH